MVRIGSTLDTTESKTELRQVKSSRNQTEEEARNLTRVHGSMINKATEPGRALETSRSESQYISRLCNHPNTIEIWVFPMVFLHQKRTP